MRLNKSFYLHKGFVGSPAHKSRTLSQATETAFKLDTVQIFPKIKSNITTPEITVYRLEF